MQLASSGDYSATSFAIRALISTPEISFKTDEDLLRKSVIRNNFILYKLISFLCHIDIENIISNHKEIITDFHI